MIVTPAEQQAVLAISARLAADPCRFEHAFVLIDPSTRDSYHPTRPTVRNLWRFVAVCARCEEQADSDTTRRLREELGEDLALENLP